MFVRNKQQQQGVIVKLRIFLALVGLSSIALADGPTTPPADGCVIVRDANANVRVSASTWSQDSGIWVQKTTQLASSNAIVPVYSSTNGCKYPINLNIDNVMLNGKPETVHIYSYMKMITVPRAEKMFIASYWTSADNGRSGWTSAYTEDLSLKKIGVHFTTERTSNATAHDDMLNIDVSFEDSNAQ